MGEKIIQCCICGRKTGTDGDRRFLNQVRYRTVTPDPNLAWVSEWKTLCKDCFEDFQRWINRREENPDDIRLEAQYLGERKE